MVSGVSALITGTRRRRQLDHASCEPRADDDRVHVARQHAAVSPTDSPRESCSSSPRRTTGVPPSSATPTSNETRVRVEGCSNTSGRRAPAERVGARPFAPAPAFSSGGAVEQRAPAPPRVELLARDEVPHRGIQGRGYSPAMEVPRPHLEPLPRARRATRPALFTWRSRLLRRTERNQTHVQVNRDLLAEFSPCSAPPSWDVALLQEVPAALGRGWPIACEPRPTACSPRATWLLAAPAGSSPPLNPDLIGSWEGRLEPDPRARRWRLARRPRSPSAASCVTRARPPERAADGVQPAPDAGRLRRQPPREQGPPSGRGGARSRPAAARRVGRGGPLIFGGDFNLRPPERVALSTSGSSASGSAAPPARGDRPPSGRGLEVRSAPPGRGARRGRRARLSDHGRSRRL